MVCMQYYEHGSLRDLLLHRHSLITDATLRYVSLDIASALVHLRQLHIVHSKLTSKSVFIRSTPKVLTLHFRDCLFSHISGITPMK